jgi:WD40 repeat protein
MTRASTVALKASPSSSILKTYERKVVVPAGPPVVSTLAGDGTTTIFNYPSGVAGLANGDIVVIDTSNHRIQRVTMSGVMSTVAGGTSGIDDGTGASAQFNFPNGIAVLPNGNIVVADYGSSRIRLVTMPGAVVTTLPGAGGGWWAPRGVAALPNGNIVVADSQNNLIKLITMPSGSITTLAGDGSTAVFNIPYGVAVLPNGDIVVADTENNRIRLITTGGVVSTLAGSGAVGSLNATGTVATFNRPQGIAVLPDGNIVVADSINDRIRLITMPGAVVSTFAGSTAGSNDGIVTNATFRGPRGITVLPNGNIVVVEGLFAGTHRVRLITLA